MNLADCKETTESDSGNLSEEEGWKARLSKVSRKELFPDDGDIYELSGQIEEILERLKKSRAESKT